MKLTHSIKDQKFKPHFVQQLGYSNKVYCNTCKSIKPAQNIHAITKQTSIIPNTNDKTLNQIMNDYVYW